MDKAAGASVVLSGVMEAGGGRFQSTAADMIKALMNWRVATQVGREFWFPLLAALVWTFFRVSRSEPDFVANLIANFSTSFFLASWATGQLYRIIYRHDVEDSFEEVGRQLVALIAMMQPMVNLANKVLESPRLDPAVRALADAAVTTGAQVTAATTAAVQAFSQVHRQRLDAINRWYLDQSNTPMAARMTNPEIYKPASELFRHRPPDKPPEATGGSG